MNVNGAGALSFGDNTATARTINITNDLTIGTSATLQSGATAAIAHTINIARHFSNDGTVNMTVGATNQTIAFNGAVDQDLSGAGTFTFYNLTVSGSGGNINVNSSILINGAANALTFSTDRLLAVNATSNVTLGAAATISNAGPLRYIQLDGSTGANSQLIKQNAGSTTAWEIILLL